MAEFSRIQAEVCLIIAPRFLNEPFQCIFGHASKVLLKYSEQLRGIPLSFTIEGVTPYGQIHDDGSVELGALIEFCVVKISPGDLVHAQEGQYLAAFPCQVDGDGGYSGDLRVVEIEMPAKIMGVAVLPADP